MHKSTYLTFLPIRTTWNGVFSFSEVSLKQIEKEISRIKLNKTY